MPPEIAATRTALTTERCGVWPLATPGL